jgi:dUTP pyrophosphatase
MITLYHTIFEETTMRIETNKILFAIDYEKASLKEKELGVKIIPCLPQIKNTGLYADAGIDLFAAYPFTVPPHDFRVVDSFVVLLMPVGVAGFIWPRGGDLFLVGSGVIDTGYTGTIKVRIVNPYSTEMRWSYGDSIGQVVLFRKGVLSFPALEEVDKVRALQLVQEISDEQGRGDDGRINQYC